MAWLYSIFGYPLGWVMWACFKVIPIYGVALLLFTIIELVGSSCYSCILYQQPISMEEYRPYLHNAITAIMKTFEEQS